MSRMVIAAVVAAVIAGLTAIAFFVTSSSFSDRAEKEGRDKIQRAYSIGAQLNQLRNIDVQNKVERLAAFPDLVAALRSKGEDSDRNAQIGFQTFVAKDGQQAEKPEVMALVDKTGNVVALYEQRGAVAGQWKNAKGESIIPAINVVLKRKVIISDVWDYGEKGLMKLGVAPVIDPDAPIADDGSDIMGAVLIAYSQTAKLAQNDRDILGTDVAYTDGKRIVATSFTTSSGEPDAAKSTSLAALLSSGALKDTDSRQTITLDGIEYYAAMAKLPQQATKPLPSDYPKVAAATIVLAPAVAYGPMADTRGTVKLFIALLGAGALVIALLGLYLEHRRLVAQVDGVEQGVTDIINGNVDRTFRPVGAELDGLANGLNVMLARLFGRPEPGEEEFDENGNVLQPGTVDFDDGGEATKGADPDLAALVQESEPDYYKRVYTEYLAAKKAGGSPDDVSFENFIAKLKVNEGKLKVQFQCRAVRFRVVTKDGKVTLKPVPIFA